MGTETQKPATNEVCSISLLGIEVREGDQLSGSWRNFDGRTYYGEGVAELGPTGAWWMRYKSGGITGLDRFFHLVNHTMPNV